MLTGRQRTIIELLNEQTAFITTGRIAQLTGVSPMTVRNDLAEIRLFLENNSEGRIIAKPNSGIKLNISGKEWERLHYLPDFEPWNKVGGRLADEIILTLLKKGEAHFAEFERRHYCSRSMIEKELPDVREWFHNHNILFQKKRGKGMEIVWREFHCRLALWQFYAEHQELPVKQLLNGFDDSGVQAAVHNLEDIADMAFSYEGHEQMVFLLSLAVVGARKRTAFEMPAVAMPKTGSDFEKRLADRLTKDLEKRYQVVLPDGERQYLHFVLLISDIQRFTGEEAMLAYQHEHIELCIVTMKLVNLFGEILNIDFRSDLLFMESMLLQLRSAIHRLSYYVVCQHPLLKPVKERYPNIFAAVYAAGIFFQKELGVEINEHEMCGIALHLGGAMERSTTILTACVVCNYGIGVSQLLKERIERRISDLQVIEVLSAREVRKLKQIKCDLVISTLPLPQIDNPIVVGHLLSDSDIEVISTGMKRIRKEKMRLKHSRNAVEIRRDLFLPDFILIGETTFDKRQLIRKMCTMLSDSGYVTEEFERSVLEHEDIAPTELGSQVALPHGYAKYVIRPAVVCAFLAEPILWQEDKTVDMVFLLAFNLDEAAGLREESVKFYGVFLDLLEDPGQLGRLKRLGSSEAVADFMNQKIRGDKT